MGKMKKKNPTIRKVLFFDLKKNKYNKKDINVPIKEYELLKKFSNVISLCQKNLEIPIFEKGNIYGKPIGHVKMQYDCSLSMPDTLTYLVAVHKLYNKPLPLYLHEVTCKIRRKLRFYEYSTQHFIDVINWSENFSPHGYKYNETKGIDWFKKLISGYKLLPNFFNRLKYLETCFEKDIKEIKNLIKTPGKSPEREYYLKL